MPKNKKLLIIIPAYNESKSLPGLISKIKKSKLSADYVVINDCSTDQTTEIAGGLGIQTINLPINLGIGGAMQTGFQYAARGGYDFAIQLDGDGQHEPREIPKLIQKLKQDNLDMVIGSRFIQDTGYEQSKSRMIGINFFSIITKVLAGKTIKDATSGFRLVNRKIIKLFAESYPSDYPEPEVLVLLNKMNYKFSEIPAKMYNRSTGQSSIRGSQSIYYMLKVLLAMILMKVRKVENVGD